MVAHSQTLIAPKGGVRIGGNYYVGGRKVPERYRRVLDASRRPVDPAYMSPDAPPNYGRSTIPHIMRFSGMQTTLSRSYRHADEALRDSIVNAHMMLNDPMITEPLFQRMRMTALNEWHLEVPDDQDPDQKALKDELTKLVEQVPYFTKYRFALQWATWFGRYGIEHTFKQFRTPEGFRRYGIKDWTPVDGDKLVFRYDDGRGVYDKDQIGVRVSAALSPVDRIAGERRLEPTADGLAYFLEPWERRFYAIHKHIIIDGHWEDPLSAGKIHGVGLRSFVYWLWYQKQEALAQLSEIVEVSARGVWIYWYPTGNNAAKEEVAKVASEQAHTNVILMPRDPESDMFGVEQVPFNAAGVEVLERLISEHFGHLIKRLILGQTLSSEADATGLGSGLADLQSDTMRQIVKFDSLNQQETITTDLVWELRDRNFPRQRDVDVQFKIDTDTDEPERVLEAAERLWTMGAELPHDSLMEKAGFSPAKPGDKLLKNPVIDQQMRLMEQHQSGQEVDDGQDQGGVLDQVMASAGGDMPPEGDVLGQAVPGAAGDPVPEPFEAGDGAQRGPVMHAKGGFSYRQFRGGNYNVTPADDGLVISQE